MRPASFLVLSAALVGLGVLPARAGEFADAIAATEAQVDFRYRYEFVEDDAFADDAIASTLRARMNFRTGELAGWRALVEVDAVLPILVDDYNSGAGTSNAGRDRYPVIADPDYVEANQAYLQYGGRDNTTLRLGRQRILLDNQRFVGGVGWRQNEQTYDAASIDFEPGEQSRVFYAYVGNVNRIFGDDVAAGDHESSTHLLNVSHELSPAAKLAGYHYRIDNDDSPSASTSTTGLRLTGKTNAGKQTIGYTVEYARQTDTANNPVDYDADYLRLELSLEVGKVTPTVGHERLAGDATRSGAAFRTPLATLHGHNGWADRFLATPSGGLVDTWFGLGGSIEEWSWKALYHDYGSEAGSGDFGTELDLSLARKFSQRYSLLFKAALFDGQSPAYADVSKFWLMLSAAF